jgi:hypothetical protein
MISMDLNVTTLAAVDFTIDIPAVAFTGATFVMSLWIKWDGWKKRKRDAVADESRKLVEQKQDHANAVAVQAVTDTKAVALATHKLVNRDMSLVRGKLAVAARRLADATGLEQDRLAADEAEAAFHQQVAAQAAVDNAQQATRPPQYRRDEP